VSAGRPLTAALLAVLLAIPGASTAQQFGPPGPFAPETAGDPGRDSRPRLATDGRGVWIAAWTNDEFPAAPYESRILVARSLDGGATWSTPAPVGSTAATTAHQDFLPEVAYDGSGTWLLAWHGIDRALGGDFDVFVSRSTDGGLTWSPAAPLDPGAAADTGDDAFVSVAGDGSGTWVAAWHSEGAVGADGDFDVLVSRSTDGGLTWSAPVLADPADTMDGGANDFAPHVVTDRAGTWLVAWQAEGPVIGGFPPYELRDDDIVVIRSTDGGATWSLPALVSHGQFQQYPRLATDRRGTWLATWHASAFFGLNVLLSRSGDGGRSWSAPEPLGAGDLGGDDYEPELAVDDTGTWVATWAATSASGALVTTILATSSRDGGASWTRATPIASLPPKARDVSPRIAGDGAGTWVAAWQRIVEDGPDVDLDVLVARGAVCGDGRAGPGEECDASFEASGGCCSACRAAPAGTPCVADANVCTADRCDGSGRCKPTAVPGCGLCEGCGSGPAVCTAEPRASCAPASRGRLALRAGRAPARNRLAWRWARGSAITADDLAALRAGDTVALCVYDRQGFVLEAAVPTDAACRRGPCWKALGHPPGRKGLRYGDAAGARDGVVRILVAPGAAGRASLDVAARGFALEVPRLPLPGALTVQLQGTGAPCWETRQTKPPRWPLNRR
jgi:hypothetical protein